MKRAVCLLLSAALLLGALSACRSPAAGPGAAGLAARELVDVALLASGYDREGGGLEYLTATVDGTEEVQGEEGRTVYFDREVLTVYLENAYNIHSAELPWDDAAVIRATGASAFEIAVVRMEDDSAAVRAATAFMRYMSARQGDFVGYAPAEADMAANGEILQDGPYAALFLCPDPKGASAAVEAALSGGELPVPGHEGPAEPITDVKELRDLLVEDQGMEGAELVKLDGDDPEALNAYMKDAYGLTQDLWTAAAIARDPETAFEVAVIRACSDGDEVLDGDPPTIFPGGLKASEAMDEKLNDYLTVREGEFDPASDQGKLLHRAIAGSGGEGDTWYAVLLVCAGQEEAMDAFARATGTGVGWSPRYRYLDTDPNFPDRCAFTPPNEDDMSVYDTSAVRTAWEKGDPSQLSKKDRKIYEAAEKVLKKVLKDGMSDYEKELVIYDWVVNNVDYDWTHQDHRKETPRESFTPYGGLVDRTAVCLGYATTFQLLCDLAGVECITVPGAAFESREDHGWNMVRLDGEWYCVDATWDANVRERGGRGRPEDWNFFNVTSDDMAASDHQWDYANTPEATAADGGRG